MLQSEDVQEKKNQKLVEKRNNPETAAINLHVRNKTTYSVGKYKIVRNHIAVVCEHLSIFREKSESNEKITICYTVKKKKKKHIKSHTKDILPISVSN